MCVMAGSIWYSSSCSDQNPIGFSQLCTMEKCLPRGGGDLWRLDKLVPAMPIIGVRAEGSWMIF